MSTPVSIAAVTKRFGATTAVDAVTLNIAQGQLFFLLGPSGCGKTTLLRLIAGFIEPNAGKIRFGERDVTRVPPNKRNTGMVFQSYALWPHMSVGQNVGFGLKVRKVARADREKRVAEALAAVQMKHLADRKPGQLSGGQQQRVALARALVVQPDVLLLDEPLSNLDAKLRLEMRREIRRLCTDTGITTIYVTHDQDEALSMADSIAVMRDGKVEQIGSPRDLYERPASRFVAGFLGETNFVPVTLAQRADGKMVLESKAGPISAAGNTVQLPNNQALCSIRPEAFRIGAGEHGANRLQGVVVETVYLGSAAQHVVELAPGLRIRVNELNPRRHAKRERLELTVDPDDVVVLPAE